MRKNNVSKLIKPKIVSFFFVDYNIFYNEYCIGPGNLLSI